VLRVFAEYPQEYVQLLLNIQESDFQGQIEYTKYIWNDKGIQEAFSRYRELSLNGYNLPDSTKYFFERLDRLLDPKTQLTDEDVLRCRAKTTALVQHDFNYKKIAFRMLDVGGQKSERRKWLNVMSNLLDAVIFCAPLSEYDVNLREDFNKNRMEDTLTLFHTVCNHKYLQAVNIILFLNKDDLFRDKIARVDPKLTFPDYTGGCNYDNALHYFKHRFQKKIFDDSSNKAAANNIRGIYIFITTATDTQIMHNVMVSVRDIIITKNVNAAFN